MRQGKPSISQPADGKILYKDGNNFTKINVVVKLPENGRKK